MTDVQDRETLSLAETVYEELKRRLNSGLLRPGAFIDQAALGEELGMSRAPLRDALIRLESEGFVSIYARRGVMVRRLDLPSIRDLYELLGALEGATAYNAFRRFGPAELSAMESLAVDMDEALGLDDFDAYYRANLAFHDVYIDLSDNLELKRQIRILKERLYDFPRRSFYIKEWELSSMREHRDLLALFRARNFAEAAAWLRDVHWSFEVQEPWIRAYYFDAAKRS